MGKKRVKKMSSLTSHTQVMYQSQFQKYFTQPTPPNPNIKAVKKSLQFFSLLEIYTAKQINLHDNFNYCMSGQ